MSVVTVNVSFPTQLWRTMDAVARREARSRSELLREAVRLYLERKNRWARLSGFWRGEARRARLTSRQLTRAIAGYRRSLRAAR